MLLLQVWKPSLRSATADSTDLWLALAAGLANELMLATPVLAGLGLLAGGLSAARQFVLGYAYLRLVRSLYGLLLSGIDEIPRLALQGDLDQQVVLPVNWVVAVALSRFDPSRIGSTTFALGLYILYARGASGWWLAMGAVPFAVLTAASLHLATSVTAAFWFPDPRNTLSASLERVTEFYQYPEVIYPGWLREILLCLPLGAAVYLPVRVLGGAPPYLVLIQAVVAVLCWAAAIKHADWSWRRYQSAGGA